MVVMKLVELADCCDDEVECTAIVFGSEFCGNEMRGQGFWLRFGLVSILEGADNNVCVLAVLLVEFHRVWVRTIGWMEESRGNFSIDAALVGQV